jgi:hypothetical protein
LFNGRVAISARNAITESTLRALAGERAFRRGLEMLGTVADLVVGSDRISATVHGSEDYAVTLTLADQGGLRGTCDCPQGQQGFFCKHCVAVGLVIARDSPFVPAPRPGDQTRAEGVRGLRSWLRARTRDELLDLIGEQLIEDSGWRRRLELRAAGAAADRDAIFIRLPDVLDVAPFAPYGYLEEGDGLRYANRIREVTSVVAGLVAAGRAADGAAVAQEALRLLADACRDARDASGAVARAAAELAVSHLRACEADSGQT